jgi:hypothetical protein
MPARWASAATVSRAWRLVPTIRMVPRLADSCLANFASWNIGSDLFQVDDVDLVAMAEDERGHLGVPEAGLVPKWTPASSISRMVTDMDYSKGWV